MSADGADRVFVSLCNKAEMPFGAESLIISTCFKEIPGDTGTIVAGVNGDKLYAWTLGVSAATFLAFADNCWRPAYNRNTDFIYFVNYTGVGDVYDLNQIHPDGSSSSTIATLTDVDDEVNAIYVDYDPDLDRIYVFHSDGYHSIKPDGTGLNDGSDLTFTTVKGGTLLRDGTQWLAPQGTGHLVIRLLSNNNLVTSVGGGHRDQTTADDDLGYIFLRNGSTIQRRDIDLANPVTIVTDLGVSNDAIYLDAASSKLYYSDDDEDIYKVNLDGSSAELVQTDAWADSIGMHGMVFCK